MLAFFILYNTQPVCRYNREREEGREREGKKGRKFRGPCDGEDGVKPLRTVNSAALPPLHSFSHLERFRAIELKRCVAVLPFSVAAEEEAAA